MTFKTGEVSNPAGRPKGVKDRRHFYHDIKARLEEEGFDPLLAMIRIAKMEEIPVNVRRQATKDVLDKVYPDLRSVEIKTDDESLEELTSLRETMRKLMLSSKKEY